jgi:single-stranded DNA-binding protein
MASLNSCCFTGNLTRDSELKKVGENDVCSFAIAVNDRKGEPTFINCDMWRPGGVTEFLTRGKAVAVSGELKCRRYEKGGEKKEIWVLEVRGLTLLGGAREREEVEAAF